VAEPTVDFIRQFLDALNAHDQDALLDLVDPDVEFHSLIQEVEGGFHGHRGARAYFDGLFATFPDFRGELGSIREHGASGVAMVRTRATSSAGVAVDLTDWLAIEVRDGRAVWWAFFRTEAEALRAAGLAS
jgi:ketosteroid isomerase-like protein